MQKILTKLLIIVFAVTILVQPNSVLADKVKLNLTNEEIAYSFFDLTHGEATLIQGNNGQTILINTGHENSEEELVERLNMFNVSTIDTLIITSKQLEYIGNLRAVLSNYHVQKILIPSSLQSAFTPIEKEFNVEIASFNKGDQCALLKDVYIDVLYVEDNKGDDEGGSAFFINHFEQRLLYMTVANSKVERELVNEYDLKSTMFKVPDFGSDRGTSEDLLNEVDPQIAVIFRNGEDLPSSYVIERLEETWIDIYQTSRIGTVTIKCDQEDYEIFLLKPTQKEKSFPSSWFTYK
ncbi:hypothetical protein QA612_08640 [Evansella sp. AB-P1]|uniref:ComEC/Rec2 family competence protein n=1 Tax=Evansella sp. AB-P1 TaxID=3037653 RepID=UPI00241CE63A|nr:hypothetical protein [Evansella sp. AB-P1]MDG5787561.1 hypothetical protein [Evansella sp. AB-P1]